MGLIHWWPLNGDVNDYGLNPIPINASPTFVNTGKIGKTTYFNGSTYYSTSTDDYSTNIEGHSLSMGGWYKHDTSTTKSDSTEGILSLNYGWTLFTTGSGIQMRYELQSTIPTVGYSCTVQDGKWHHIFCTLDYKSDGTSVIKLYYDGNVVKTQNITATIFWNRWYFNRFVIGVESNNSSICACLGWLNDIRIYNHCLSPKEVKEISKALILHYNFEDEEIEPTVNLNNSLYYSITNSTGWGGHRMSSETVTFTDAPIKVGNHFVVSYSGSDQGGAGISTGSSIRVNPNTLYTYSLFIKASDDFEYSNANFLYVYERTNENTAVKEFGCASTTRKIPCGNGWYRWWGQFTTNSQTYNVNLNFYTYPYKNVEYWVGGLQLEAKDHVTPYTQNTRGIITKYDKTVYTEADGSKWLKIAHHNNPASGNLFSSSDTFSAGVYKDADRWFDAFQPIQATDSYEFMVKQKTTSSASETKYRWIQYKSPLTAVYNDVAPNKVLRITTSGYTNGNYGGLYILNSNTYMCIANTSNGNWFGAFGCWTTYSGGIPGYPNTAITTGYIDLYIRITEDDIPKVFDSSGFEYNGNINGNIQILHDAGIGTNSLYIPNGVTDYISSSNLIWPTDNITIQYWWKSSNKSPTGDYHIPVSSNTAGCYEMSIYKGGQTRNGLYIAGSRVVDNGTSSKLLDGNWHLCIMTYNGSVFKRYVDGVSEKDSSASGALSGGTGLVLGHYGTNTSYAVKEGYISDFKIYATALSPADVLKEYRAMGNVDNDYNLSARCFVEDTTRTTFAKLNKNGVFNTRFIEEFPSHLYEKVEFIKNTTTAYIDTGIIPMNKKFIMDIQFTSNETRQLMGISGSDEEYFGNNKGTWEKIGNSNNVSTLSRCLIHYDVGNITTNRVTTWIDGSSTVFTGAASSDSTFITYAATNMNVFSLYDIYNCKMKLFDLKVYDKSGVLEHHFIPVKRLSDSKYGLYDTFTGEFKSSANNSVFSYETTYERLQYIESTGTQYINTNLLIGNSYTSRKTEIKFEYSTVVTGVNYNAIYGVDSNLQLGMYTSNRHFTNGTADSGYTLELNRKYIYVGDYNNGKSYINGTELLTRSFGASNYAYIFSANNSGSQVYPAAAKLYYCKIYESNNLVRDFVPARRLSDSAIGLYDKANDVFYTNAGSGTFTAGPVYEENHFTTYDDGLLLVNNFYEN